MKKNKLLILHIGTTKTGSTSIQHSLGKSRVSLLEHDIYYPSIKPYNHIFTFPPIFMDDPEKIPLFRRNLQQSDDKNAKIQGFRKAWLKEFEACNEENFIISAEHLSTPVFVEDSIKHLKRFIEPYFEKVTVIAYVRHHDQWIASQLQQAVKNGSKPLNIRRLTNYYLSCPSGISYQNSLDKWSKFWNR